MPQKNSLQFINISSLSAEMGSDFSRSLAVFHSFTGCDQLPCFAGKGKLKPLKILKSSSSYLKAFASLGSSEIVSEEVVKEIERFTCQLYNITSNTDKNKTPEVNDARFQIFAQKYDSPKKLKGLVLQVKGIDGSNFPPCKSSLLQQIYRANCLCSVWNHAYSFQSKMFLPDGNGWEKIQNESGQHQFILNWFEGDILPKKLDDFLENDPQTPGQLSQQQDKGERNETEELPESDREDELLDNDSEEEEVIRFRRRVIFVS